MINNNNLSDEISELRRTCTQMMATNEILCKSNKIYQEKWDSVLYAIDFYKAFFHKYMNLISIRKPSTRNAIVEIPNLEALKKINEALVQELELKPLTENKIKNQDIVFQKEDYITPVKNKERLNEYGFTKDQSKAYLLSLAKELASKSDLYKAGLERSKNVHRKRSMSNALDYVYERRRLALKPIQEENPEDRKLRKEHRKCSLNYNPTERIPDNLKGGLNMNKRITSHTQKILLNEAKRSEGHLSFSIDIEELDRVKATEASFISTNDIFHTIE